MADDLFDEWYGKALPRKVPLILSTSEEVMTAAGKIALQWSAFLHTLEHEIAMTGRHPAIPADKRRDMRNAPVNDQLTYLRDVAAGFVFADSRPQAANEYRKLMSTLLSAKGIRDQLIHGTFALDDNRTAGEVVVQYKWKKHRLTTKRLRVVADVIAEAHGTLMGFNSWANYETFKKLSDELERMAGAQAQ